MLPEIEILPWQIAAAFIEIAILSSIMRCGRKPGASPLRPLASYRYENYRLTMAEAWPILWLIVALCGPGIAYCLLRRRITRSSRAKRRQDHQTTDFIACNACASGCVL